MDEELANNRRYVRRSLKSRVTVVTQAAREHVGTLVDVSEQGFGITCYRPYTPEQVHALALLHLPQEQDSQRLVELDARCVWCRQIGAAHYASGFAIESASAPARRLLDELLLQHD